MMSALDDAVLLRIVLHINLSVFNFAPCITMVMSDYILVNLHVPRT